MIAAPPKAHVAHAGSAMAQHCRRKGMGHCLCPHSLQAFQSLGFRATPLDLVLFTNTAALPCWERHGFQTVSPLPAAFCHQRLGSFDALVMAHRLVEGPKP